MRDGYHYIQNGDGEQELFNLSTDLDEEINVAYQPQNASTIAQFQAELKSLIINGK